MRTLHAEFGGVQAQRNASVEDGTGFSGGWQKLCQVLLKKIYQEKVLKSFPRRLATCSELR